jgi:cytochrome c nitrite reductase small subunit
MGQTPLLSTAVGRAATLALLLGIFVGVGLFTFRYADGLSYFSSDPAACANCHIMNDQYASWRNGSHHGDAKCVDCHLPHGGLAKWLAKGENGYHHSKGFTLQDFPEPILIKAKNAAILQGNCVRCHGEFVHAIVAGGPTGRDAARCVHCHRGVGHGARG